MLLTFLKSKIHRATVTGGDIDYNGSITVDCLLLEAANIAHFEQVEVYNITNGERFTTYAIPAPEGSGDIIINGAAVHKAKKSDLIIICTYCQLAPQEATLHEPMIVLVDATNKMSSSASEPRIHQNKKMDARVKPEHDKR